MVEAGEVKFSLRVVMNKEENKVHFAEVDSSFADVLLSFLSLPLGTIVRLLTQHYGDETPTIGSLNTLYQGLANLDSSNFWTEMSKLVLLNPSNSLEPHCRNLKLNVDNTEPTKYYVCDGLESGICYTAYVSIHKDVKKCDSCRKSLNKEINSEFRTASEASEVLTKGTMCFLISDDLHMVPSLPGSGIQILQNLGIEDVHGLMERTVVVGFNEIMDLLKWSLVSRTPLTDLVLNKMCSAPISVNFELGASVPQAGGDIRYKMTTVKAIMQKSTNKVLIAQAGEDFVDLLFSMLMIPLGRAILLLGTNTCLGSIGNLYKSVADLDGQTHLKSQDVKEMLLNPNLPPGFPSKNQRLFHIKNERSELSLILSKKGQHPGYFTSSLSAIQAAIQGDSIRKTAFFVDTNDKVSYVKGPGIFMVTDDLAVTPPLSAISFFNCLKAPLSDVEEVTVEIGLLEVLNILKASLSSTSALTNGLTHVLKSQSVTDKKRKVEDNGNGKTRKRGSDWGSDPDDY